MSGLLAAALAAAGIALLVKGGDWTVDGTVAAAGRLRLPPFFIACTVLALGTSLPELFASVNAALSGLPGLAAGNVFGSNIANVLLVLPAAALAAPLVFRRTREKTGGTDATVSLAAALAALAAVTFGILPAWAGIAMIAGLSLWIWTGIRSGRIKADATEDEDAEEPDGKTEAMRPVPVLACLVPALLLSASMLALWSGLVPLMPGLGTVAAVAYAMARVMNREYGAGSGAGPLLFGIAALLAGAELLVSGAASLGESLGVPPSVIGLTAVAFGTSLPELSASVTAARRGQGAIVLGNVIGSNIFNVLLVLAAAALAAPPMQLDGVLSCTDAAAFAFAALLLAWYGIRGRRLGRTQAAAMLAVWLAFIALQGVTLPCAAL